MYGNVSGLLITGGCRRSRYIYLRVYNIIKSPTVWSHLRNVDDDDVQTVLTLSRPIKRSTNMTVYIRVRYTYIKKKLNRHTRLPHF